jgi:gas vesicle structural protein
MAVERIAPQANLSEVLDRVLDRGIVIDAWLRVSVAGLALIDVDARVVVASISTYVQASDALALTAPVARPAPRPVAPAPAVRPTGSVTLRCAEGCTFIRSARRRPKSVRCPSASRRSCPVGEFAVAA